MSPPFGSSECTCSINCCCDKRYCQLFWCTVFWVIVICLAVFLIYAWIHTWLMIDEIRKEEIRIVKLTTMLNGLI